LNSQLTYGKVLQDKGLSKTLINATLIKLRWERFHVQHFNEIKYDNLLKKANFSL